MIARVARRVHTARDVNKVFEQNLSFGERLADKVAVVAGSWTFILSFCAFLAAWAVLNAVVLVAWAFDPYPFIFLNLLLSMLAALQAPIIMMSQNRQAAKDRLAASLDYEVNVEGRVLHRRAARQGRPPGAAGHAASPAPRRMSQPGCPRRKQSCSGHRAERPCLRWHDGVPSRARQASPAADRRPGA